MLRLPLVQERKASLKRLGETDQAGLANGLVYLWFYLLISYSPTDPWAPHGQKISSSSSENVCQKYVHLFSFTCTSPQLCPALQPLGKSSQQPPHRAALTQHLQIALGEYQVCGLLISSSRCYSFDFVPLQLCN